MVETQPNVVLPMTVTIQRFYNGRQPQWDNGTWFPMEVFTVDRVYLNRYGGVTAEGLAWCPSLAASPFGEGSTVSPYIAIDWDATQYVGRTTAIHGSYGSDIATPASIPLTRRHPFGGLKHPSNRRHGWVTARTEVRLGVDPDDADSTTDGTRHPVVDVEGDGY
jgi:hypothetical protein